MVDVNRNHRFRSGQLASGPPFYDWMTNEPGATRAWYPQDIPAALPPDAWDGPSSSDCRWNNFEGAVPRTLADFNGRPGMLFDGSQALTASTKASNPLTWPVLLGAAQPSSWGLVFASKPSSAPIITAPDPVTGIGGTPYDAAMLVADQNFRAGFGFARWDPGGGNRYYWLSFVFNGGSFCSSWVDLGAALSPLGYITTARQTFDAGGADFITAGTQNGEGAPHESSPGMGTGYTGIVGGRGGPGFRDNHFTGLLGGVFAKSNDTYPGAAVANYADWWNL